MSTSPAQPREPASFGRTVVFFRDDDMGCLLEPLRNVMQVLREGGVPCSYEAVPEVLTSEVARMALQEKEKAPELIDFHQHGLRHSRLVAGVVDYAEFGGERPLADQEQDIGLGRRLLREKLGEAFDGDVFTPPCHKYDRNTLRALQNVGIRTLSAGVRTSLPARVYYGAGRALRRVDWLGRRVSYHGRRIPGTRLSELSTCIDFDLADGEARARGVDEQWQRFEVCRRRLAIVGVNLHHASYGDAAKVETLRAFVQRLLEQPDVTLRSMRELCTAIS